MSSFKVCMLFVLLASFFSNGSKDDKGVTDAAPVIFDGSSNSFMAVNSTLVSDTWELADSVHEDVKREKREGAGLYRGSYRDNRSGNLLFRWIFVGALYGLIMGCCFGKRNIRTWMRGKPKHRGKLHRIKITKPPMPKSSVQKASKPASDPTEATLLTAKAPILTAQPSTSASESSKRQPPISTEQFELEPIAGTSSQY